MASAQGMISSIWAQNMPHGNKYLELADVALLIQDLCSSTMWLDYGCVEVKMDGSEKVAQHLYRTVAQDIQKMKGKLGPCAGVGLFTGGGLPHSPFATQVQTLPGFKDQPANRHESGVTNIPLQEGIAIVEGSGRTMEKWACKGLAAHTDNNIIPGAKEVWHLQGQVVFAPAQRGFQQGALIAAATASSTCEWGCLGEGPKDRPCPDYISGGADALKVSEAKHVTAETQQSFIKHQWEKNIQNNIPPPLGSRGRLLFHLQSVPASRLVQSFDLCVARVFSLSVESFRRSSSRAPDPSTSLFQSVVRPTRGASNSAVSSSLGDPSVTSFRVRTEIFVDSVVA